MEISHDEDGRARITNMQLLPGEFYQADGVAFAAGNALGEEGVEKVFAVMILIDMGDGRTGHTTFAMPFDQMDNAIAALKKLKEAYP